MNYLLTTGQRPNYLYTQIQFLTNIVLFLYTICIQFKYQEIVSARFLTNLINAVLSFFDEVIAGLDSVPL